MSLQDLQRQLEEERFAKWIESIQQAHLGGRFTPNPEQYWTPLARPIRECTVALVSSIGIHTADQQPFDILDPHGDWSIRKIPGDVESAKLRATHGHVDTGPANQDINCAFPIDRLRELAAEGVVGGVSPVHVGFMGFCPDSRHMRDETGPEIARLLQTAGAEAVVLTAG